MYTGLFWSHPSSPQHVLMCVCFMLVLQDTLVSVTSAFMKYFPLWKAKQGPGVMRFKAPNIGLDDEVSCSFNFKMKFKKWKVFIAVQIATEGSQTGDMIRCHPNLSMVQEKKHLETKFVFTIKSLYHYVLQRYHIGII